MTRGITEKEPDPRIVYADIIDHPHWQSPTRPHMSLYDRAAQFSPFAALTGYDDMVSEEARLTKKQRRLEDWEIEKISEKLNLIADVIADGQCPTLSITYFEPDKKKSGGAVIETTESVKGIDPIYRKVILMSTEGSAGINKTIDFDKILAIKGDLVDYLDDIAD